MNFKKLCKSLLKEMAGQLDELDYIKNPDAPIGASGVVGSKWHPMKDADIKKASNKKAIDLGNNNWDSDDIDTKRAKAAIRLDDIIKNKKKFKNATDLENQISPLVGVIKNLNKFVDENGHSIPEEKRTIRVLKTGKNYTLKQASEILITLIKKYEKPFNLILAEVKDPIWRQLASQGIYKDQVGFFSRTLDTLCPIAGIPRQMTRGQEEGKRYILALDKTSDLKNNVWVLWRRSISKNPATIKQFIGFLRHRLGSLDFRSKAAQEGKGTTLQRENEQGNLPLKFLGMDQNGYPQFGDQLTFAEVRNTSIKELLELTGHYQIKEVVEGWDDQLPKYAQYDIQRFVARGANQQPTAKKLRVKKEETPNFILKK